MEGSGSLSRSTTTQENQSPENVSPPAASHGILRRPEASVSPKNPVISTSAEGSGTLTLNQIRDAKRKLNSLPPPPVFASWDGFSREGAISIEVAGRTYVGAHPDFWAKLPGREFIHGPVLLPIQILDLSWPSNVAVKNLFIEKMRQATAAILKDCEP